MTAVIAKGSITRCCSGSTSAPAEDHFRWVPSEAAGQKGQDSRTSGGSEFHEHRLWEGASVR